jgi:hypothetical protein
LTPRCVNLGRPLSPRLIEQPTSPEHSQCCLREFYTATARCTCNDLDAGIVYWHLPLLYYANPRCPRDSGHGGLVYEAVKSMHAHPSSRPAECRCRPLKFEASTMESQNELQSSEALSPVITLQLPPAIAGRPAATHWPVGTCGPHGAPRAVARAPVARAAVHGRSDGHRAGSDRRPRSAPDGPVRPWQFDSRRRSTRFQLTCSSHCNSSLFFSTIALAWI